MNINGREYTEPELRALVHELQGRIEKQDRFIHCVRSYYRENIAWDDLFEEDFKQLATDTNVGGKGGAEHDS